MIILDTNVVSEAMRRRGDPAVAAWLDRQHGRVMCITAVTAAELLRGVALLPEGKRKADLAGAVALLLETEFEGRILPFDEQAAVNYADLSARRQRRGLSTSVADTMIAAITEVSGAEVLATRNVGDFDGIRVEVLNPWVD
ncbi:VapC toxin family PIN domain ribonuclease [Subtercola boreus]|uniref:Ribonuclease VapC n=1 Tax=Subtercola boreus TaxID=120213 RepID=A0A3E0VH81_9MICO|nr:type II toxin-antitoxin system VapC family toxin [Subtercola boreus]RFA09296.1 VapC toxin family PIN domain ribonuclease [Subtercola boreus]TQL53676.1 hypothetical protein FB464_1192 [Subtercola boreus]